MARAGPVRHEIPSTAWPTRAQAQASRLFQRLDEGRLSLWERTWVPAMVPWRASDSGFVTDDVLEWYGRFAEGQPGAIVVEATGIRDVPSGPLLRIGDDRFIDGLSKLVETVRDRSGGRTRLFIQCIDFLAIKRRPDPAKFFDRFLVLTDGHRHRMAERLQDPGCLSVSEPDFRSGLAMRSEDEWEAILTRRELESLRHGYRERVTDLDLPHVRDLPKVLPELFAQAAIRAEQAGFDGVELHYAHAYTMASFLSRLNDRPDGYGGTRQGRLRLPLEVFDAVRSSVSSPFIVGCRMLGEEVIEGGSDLDDAREYGVAFASAGMDFLSISKGGKFEDAKQPKIGQAAYPYTGKSGHECMPTIYSDERGPFGRNLPIAAAVREAIRAQGLTTPVVAAGGINTFELAEGALERGEADIIASARGSLADPDWFAKARLGLGDQVRRCQFTNYCEGLDQQHKQVTCRLWDRSEAAPDGSVSMSRDGRRRLIAPAWRRPPGSD